MPLLIINAAEVRELLTTGECIEVMAHAMRAYSGGTVTSPSRIIAALDSGKDFFILMPGELHSPPVYGAKIVSLHPANPDQGRPAVQGFVTLFDHETGEPTALVDGAAITSVRTAAASALATRELARVDAASHGILGTGVQAASHLRSINRVRNIERVLIWGRNGEKARHLAGQFTESTGISSRAVEDPAQVAGCDVVSVVTNSPDPVLLGRWLRQGAHVNLVGAHEAEHREADSEAVVNAAVYVDSRHGALREAGDILIPISEGKMTENDIAGEIGEVLLGTAPGRQSDREITLYKSLGIVAQDLFAAQHVLISAMKAGKGQLVEF